MEVAILISDPANCTYVFCFFAYKNGSAEVAMPIAKAFLSKTFLVIFVFSIAKL